MNIIMSEDDYNSLSHIGIIRRSGRYPWGSGKNPYQRSVLFKKYLDEMKAQGLTEKQIADGLTEFVQAHGGGKFDKVTTADVRAGIGISTDQIRHNNVTTAVKLAAKGMSNGAIAEQMGLGSGKSAESTVRGWLKNYDNLKESSLQTTVNLLKSQVEQKPYLDVGKGNHLYMGINETKLKTALAALKDEGYAVHPVDIDTAIGNQTRTLVLSKPGTTWSEAAKAVRGGQLQVVTAQSDDNGLSFKTAITRPISVNSKTIEVRYGPDGGAHMDGVIEIRRGVPELDLGASRYAQVRIAVDDSHYLKGMAMYADDLPPGVNMRFNTNKKDTGDKLAAMKPMEVNKLTGEIDRDRPFGSSTYPHVWTDKYGKEHTSPLNIVGNKETGGNIEGRWDEWSKAVSSQMLSKQAPTLAAQQLNKARQKREDDLHEILSMTNPVVRQKLLEEYADSADAAAVHLKAAAFDRQSTHVILPMNNMRPHEIYAPQYNDGEKVVLVRHPHGGPFEIPELTVNNKSHIAKRILGNATDAVGIHWTVAEQLSGADFDGDTVLVIPNDSRKIKTRPPLEGLKNFDAKAQYKIADDDTTTKRMTKRGTQTEMGKISNLITDMTIKGASAEDLAKAVRHSMVVIDAEKHGLDYRQSEVDNSISALKKRYQGAANAGAATIISRAGSDDRKVPERRLQRQGEGVDPAKGPVNKETGELIYVPTGRTYISKKTGLETPAYQTVPKMALTKDARTLLSGGVKEGGVPMEEIYASHANAMKALANQARREAVNTQNPTINKSSKALYHEEVTSLTQKLQIAQRNAPLERRAQAMASSLAKAKLDANPQLDTDSIKKVKYQALEDARTITGANKTKVYITDREWAAIQSRAIGSSRLHEILTHADMDRVKELATPRYRGSLTPGQLARAKALASLGRSTTEIAQQLGIPRSTLSDNLKNS